MKKCRMVVAVVAAMMATPAMAGEWWLVFMGGEKPARLIVAVDEAFLDPVPFTKNSYKLETFSLMEHPKSPDSVTSNVIVDCDEQTLEEKLIQVSPRDDFVKTVPDQPAHPPKDAVDRKLVEFACEMGPKAQAERLAMRKANNSERGLLFMGPLTTTAIGDFAWKNFWSDGKRPVVASKRSKQEMDAKMAELAERRKAALAEANAIAGQVVEADKQDQQRTADVMALTAANASIAKARKKREPREVRNGLDPWIGHGETELVGAWGKPTTFEDKGAQRILHYYKATVLLGPDPSQGCGAGNMYVPDPNSRNGGMMCVGGAPARSETNVDCTASFEIRDGMIVDYVTKGQSLQSLSYSNSCSAIFGKSN
ncbi:hypothetical protein [Lysobacter sp. Root604]|uniref:hypothetical protein n=1 Tax=Lysobacter sp. Root604 TaxID=1736568 RepID=UPI000A6A18DA|nr:hypothetical protein [Lysobacter sp. Root604]